MDNESHMQITILGAGYVGLTTASLLACAGYKVYVVEPNQERLDVIREGRSFFYETGLDPIIKAGIESGNLNPTDSYEESVAGSKIVFSCVGTPDNPDGSSNLSYVHAAAETAATYMKTGTIYVQKSTVPVGTGRTIERRFSALNKTVSYVSNPEFLREGTALFDTLYFDRIVVGGDDQHALEEVLDLYRKLELHRDEISKLASVENGTTDGKYIATHLNSAELIKVTSNAFLALKISFANSIAKLSDAVDADVVEVMDAVGADKRIGRAFLNAGRGYGGGCFPKDVSGLIASSLEHGVDMEIMQAAQVVNLSMPGYIIEKLQTALGGDIDNRRIAVLGLAFKAGTSDVRRSPGVALANLLEEYGATVMAFDPGAGEEARDELRAQVTIAKSLDEALTGCDAVVIATNWPEFNEKHAEYYAASMSGAIFVDAMNMFTQKSIEDAGLHYIGIGR